MAAYSMEHDVVPRRGLERADATLPDDGHYSNRDFTLRRRRRRRCSSTIFCRLLDGASATMGRAARMWRIAHRRGEFARFGDQEMIADGVGTGRSAAEEARRRRAVAETSHLVQVWKIQENALILLAILIFF